MPTFHLEIITPERVKYNDQVVSAEMPGVEGQMGLLANHAPILALLQPGVLTVRGKNKDIRLAVGGGFVKMSDNRAVALVDFAERAEEIDAEKARQARIALEKELGVPMSVDAREPLRMRLREQTARLEVAAKG